MGIVILLALLLFTCLLICRADDGFEFVFEYNGR